MDLISKLPPETFLDILRYIPVHHLKLGGLTACCLVSKRFYEFSSPLLYNHVTLKYFPDSGFKPQIMSLLQSSDWCLQHIRKLSLRIANSVSNDASSIMCFANDRIKEEMRVFFHVLIDRIGLERLGTLELDYSGLLEFLVPGLEHKLKRLRCILVDQWDFMRPYDGITIDPRYESFPVILGAVSSKISSLERLTIGNINEKTVLRFDQVWQILRTSKSRLKYLRLNISQYPPFAEYPPFATEPEEFKEPRTNLGHYLQEIQQLDSLEELHFETFRDLHDIGAIQFQDHQRIKRLSFLRCGSKPLPPRVSTVTIDADHKLSASWLGRMHHLTELDVRSSGVSLCLGNLLPYLHLGLTTLFWTRPFRSSDNLYPTMKVLGKHCATLKKLWLEARLEWDKWEEVPADLDESRGTNDLTLATLAELPVLECLSIPIRKPNDWMKMAPKFPSLKYLYLPNLNPSPVAFWNEESSRTALKILLETWLVWLIAPYEESSDDESLEISEPGAYKLRVLSTYVDLGRDIPIRRIVSMCRYLDRLGWSILNPEEPPQLGYWYPEAQEFIDKGRAPLMWDS